MEIILSLAGGILFGAIAGILPGIHPNLLATIMVAVNPFTLTTSVAFLTGMAMTNTFLNIIPTVYLSAPDPDNALALQPTHQFFYEGRGHEAVLINLLGSFTAAVVAIAGTPLVLLILKVYTLFEESIPYLLLVLIGLLLVKEKEKMLAFTVFLLSGALGLLALNTTINEPLLPLFSGLFGIPSVISSIQAKFEPVQQHATGPKMSIRKIARCTVISQGVGVIFSMLPSLGPSQAAAIGLWKSKSVTTYLMVVGALNTISIVVSAVTFYQIDKARNGIIHAIQTLSHGTEAMPMLTMIALFLISLGPSVVLTIVASRSAARLISKIQYKKVMIGVLVLMVALIVIVSGVYGTLLAMAATLVGTIPLHKEMRRSHLMGCLMVPTILYYLTH